jgi:hypothetical protein
MLVRGLRVPVFSASLAAHGPTSGRAGSVDYVANPIQYPEGVGLEGSHRDAARLLLVSTLGGLTRWLVGT